MKNLKLSKIQKKKLKLTKWQRIKEQEWTTRHISLKNDLLSRISQSNNLKQIFYVGLNSIMKSIEVKSCEIVCLCRDVPKNLLDSLVEACLYHKIPVVPLPGLSTKEVATSFSIKRVSCFALPTSGSIEQKCIDEQDSGAIDGIRDILFKLSSNSEESLDERL